MRSWQIFTDKDWDLVSPDVARLMMRVGSTPVLDAGDGRGRAAAGGGVDDDDDDADDDGDDDCAVRATRALSAPPPPPPSLSPPHASSFPILSA